MFSEYISDLKNFRERARNTKLDKWNDSIIFHDHEQWLNMEGRGRKECVCVCGNRDSGGGGKMLDGGDSVQVTR